MGDKPTRYYISWGDTRKQYAIAISNGCAPEDVDPADYWEGQEAAETLVAAISKAIAINLRTHDDILIYERHGMYEHHPDEDHPDHTEWDWDWAENIGLVHDGHWHRN